MSSLSERKARRRAEYLRNVKWLEENREKLAQKFPELYVAVCGYEVIDATRLDELMEKLSARGKDPSVCAIDLLSRKEHTLIV